ncbi:hypothetical protein SLEP1_g39908 [Rubroshorea leprosula]|uniref:Uncharacterized protein n=1 Tax=Rubroshorea leprosula TaxID=152421 RepID=A0AAV5L290_9ROSI|nr:hypothetical protein SLEP1_g39908 [Rubroshorea leprosula]
MAAESVTKDEMVKVKVTGKSQVKPGKDIGRRECQLVTFDLPYLAFYYNQKLLFYRGGDGFEEKVEKLKDGLRVVLEEFYQLAGKLGKDEEGVFRVEYDDEMDGVEVVEAVAEGISIDDLAAEEEVTSTMKQLIPFNGILNLEGLHRPLLAVQDRNTSHWRSPPWSNKILEYMVVVWLGFGSQNLTLFGVDHVIVFQLEWT